MTSTTPSWTGTPALHDSLDTTDSLTAAFECLAINKPKKPFNNLWDLDTAEGFVLNTGKIDGEWNFDCLLNGDRADKST